MTTKYLMDSRIIYYSMQWTKPMTVLFGLFFFNQGSNINPHDSMVDHVAFLLIVVFLPVYIQKS